jgi:hypothetical protein
MLATLRPTEKARAILDERLLQYAKIDRPGADPEA